MTDTELCAWLRANSSGIYRPAAEAAATIERLTAERDAARADERERCAKLCDKISTKMDSQCPGSHVGYWPANVGHAIAAAIRASEGQA